MNASQTAQLNFLFARAIGEVSDQMREGKFHIIAIGCAPTACGRSVTCRLEFVYNPDGFKNLYAISDGPYPMLSSSFTFDENRLYWDKPEALAAYAISELSDWLQTIIRIAPRQSGIPDGNEVQACRRCGKPFTDLAAAKAHAKGCKGRVK